MTPPEAESPLQLLETSLPLPDDDQPTELPKRRKYQRRPNSESAEVEASSTDVDQPRRRYQRRVVNPIKIVERDAEALEGQLAAIYVFIGGAVSMIAPVTGTTMILRANQGAAAVVEAAKANPRIAAILIAALKVGHYGPLVMFGMTIIIAVGVDIGAVPPTSTPAQMMLADVLARFQQTQPPPPSQTVASNGNAAQASGDASA